MKDETYIHIYYMYVLFDLISMVWVDDRNMVAAV